MVEMNKLEELLMEYDKELHKLNFRIKKAIEYLEDETISSEEWRRHLKEILRGGTNE